MSAQQFLLPGCQSRAAVIIEMERMCFDSGPYLLHVVGHFSDVMLATDRIGLWEKEHHPLHHKGSACAMSAWSVCNAACTSLMFLTLYMGNLQLYKGAHAQWLN